MKKRYFLPLCLWLLASTAVAEPLYPELLSPEISGYRARAEEFGHVDNYQAAADQLQRLRTEGLALDSEEAQKFLYLLATSYSETGNDQCLLLLDRYLRLYPASPDATDAIIARSDFLFFAKRYSEALESYDALSLSHIDPAKLDRTTYRKAFCQAKCGFFKEAYALFGKLTNDKKYDKAALFGQGYCDYMTGNYDGAYSKFEQVDRLLKNRSGKTVTGGKYTPTGLETAYYLAQIDYARGDFSRAAERAATALRQTPVPGLTNPTRRVLGLSYFKLDERAKALKALQQYVEKAGEGAEPDAVYALATLLFEQGSDAEAAELFGRLTDGNDELAQASLLSLGQIAVREGDDNAASIYFEKASRMPFDKDVSRLALYNYAAARTHGGRVPFSSQTDLLEEFLVQYPGSEHAPAVREYLAAVYYHEKDYEKALERIDQIRNPGAKVLSMRQKTLYELGVRAMQSGEPREAVYYLQDAVAMGNRNKKLLPEAYLWLGDALYARHDFTSAAGAYSNALNKGLTGTNAALARYGLAYARMQAGNYSKAAEDFAKAASAKGLSSRLRADSKVRQADCLFYTGHNDEARILYAESIGDPDSEGSDYSAWRHAAVTGAMGDRKKQIKELEVLSTTASSRWMPEILSDLAEAYARSAMNSKAETTVARLIKEYPDSEAAPRGALILAELYDSSDYDDQAEVEYRKIIERWPSSPQAQTADSEMRAIAARNGTLSEYARFLRSTGARFSINDEDMERLSFEAAIDAFNADETDIDLMEDYVEKFPSGPHSQQALHALATGREAKGNHKGALLLWRRLMKQGDSAYLPDAIAGVMRTSDDPQERLHCARLATSTAGVSASARADARFIEAEALASAGKGKEAAEIWQELSAAPASLSGAKSAVALGEYQLRNGQRTKAMKTLTTFIDSGTPHSYWLARAYITLADTYIAEGKKSLARQYLESLRDNYPGGEADIREMVSKRLSKL